MWVVFGCWLGCDNSDTDYNNITKQNTGSYFVKLSRSNFSAETWSKPNSNFQAAVGMKDIRCHEILRVNSFSTEPTNKDSSLSTDGRTKKIEKTL